MIYFPEEVLEHVFAFLKSQKDRNSISLVCKLWFKIERFSRERIFIGNCYAISPERVVARFPRLKAVILKGKPHFADFNLVPRDWGGFVLPWIEVLAKNCPNLEHLRLKRMMISDECLDLVSRAFLNFKSLVLVSCDGFSTTGLSSIAANCRYLEELELQEIEMEDTSGQWLSCFPESSTSLVSLNFACLKGEVSSSSLERLVSRSRNLRSLKMNRSVDTETLQRILASSPDLIDLGIGSFLHGLNSEAQAKIKSSFQKCKFIKSLSGFLDVSSRSLSSVYPICSGLTSLNLSYASGLEAKDLVRLIRHCRKLQKLQVLDFIGDKGLRAVASFCKDVEELRVFPSDPLSCRVTDEGLVAISSGCHKLHSLLYFCSQMTNEALIKVAENCPHFTRFRLCILTPRKPDPITHGPLDEGFGAVVRSCRSLRRLSVSGLLTDRVFLYIGMYAERLEMLSVAFAGESDEGMMHVLNGCRRLRKLEIRDSPFSDGALLWNVGKYEAMRSLWMSSCEISFGGCKEVARLMPRLNVEIIHENDEMEFCDENDIKVDKLYLYRTLSGPRADAPSHVWTL